MKKRLLIYSILILAIYGCNNTSPKFVDENDSIKNIPYKLEFYKAFSTKAEFVITEREELNNVVNEIRNADNAGPWKGVGWNQIKLYCSDTIITLNTNNKVIGKTFANGWFYELQENNFIERYTTK